MLNNVNASPNVLTAVYLDSVRMIADVLRPYGVRVYLSVNFASPKVLGATKTADPFDALVVAWWSRKVKEIYAKIPISAGSLSKPIPKDSLVLSTMVAVMLMEPICLRRL